MTTNTKINLQEYITKGISFKAYNNLMEDYENNFTIEGYEQYYPLNLKRIQRLNKTLKFSEAQLSQLNQIEKNNTLLIITEGWCGDAAQVLPVVDKMVQNASKLEVAIVFRDQNLKLIDSYLTNSGRSIPKIIGIDKSTGDELFAWGPRPNWSDDLLRKYKSGEWTKDQFLLEIQKMYNKDKGNAIFNELIKLIN